MIRFDTSNRKPKLWNLAILSAVTAGCMAVLIRMGSGAAAAGTISGTGFLLAGVLLCLYLALVIVLLMRAFIGQLKYNPYSYNTIYYVGFALFVLSALVTQTALIVSAFRAFGGGAAGSAIPVGGDAAFAAGNDAAGTAIGTGIAELIQSALRLLGSARFYIMLSFPFILVYSAGLGITNIWLIRHEGRSPVNLMGILLAAVLVGGEILLFFSVRTEGGLLHGIPETIAGAGTPDMLRHTMVHEMAINLYAAIYLYFECMLIGTIIANIIVVRYEPEKDKDYIIILGCGIRKDGTPTPLLRGRIDRAYAFYEEQIRQTGRAPIFVTSGGQGPDEIISESESMKRCLLSKGVPEEHILQEERSVDTYENMLFSKRVIAAAAGGPDAPEIGEFTPLGGKIIYATTNYHVFRSGLMARRVKMRAIGIGARTKWYFWPNASVREFAGLLTKHRLKQALVLGGVVLFYGISTAVLWNMIR